MSKRISDQGPRATALVLPPIWRQLLAPVESTLLALGAKRTPLTPGARAKVIADLFHEGDRRTPFLHRFYCLMSLSVVIAVLGLLANSTAVVIGAMLVAPLMAPVLGISAALVMDWPQRAMKAAMVAATGAGLAVALAALVSAIIPGSPHPLPSELLARTSPTMVDLGVALVAGAAGAYSHVRQQASDAIVGVAVAVALIPPLAVLGVTLQMGLYQLSLGAFLLFLANVSGIITSGCITFILFGLVPLGRLSETSTGIARGLRLATIGTMIVIAPLQIIDEWRPQPTIESQPEDLVMATVDQWRGDIALIAVKVDMQDSEAAPRIELTLASKTIEGQPLDVEQLASDLATEIGRPVDLIVTSLESTTSVVSSPSPAEDVGEDGGGEGEKPAAEGPSVGEPDIDGKVLIAGS